VGSREAELKATWKYLRRFVEAMLNHESGNRIGRSRR